MADADWHTSSYSGSGTNCVEHAILPTGFHAVRDTKDRERAALSFPPAAWQTFLSGVRSDLPAR
ncbi:DUF397 domain-containing protein [Streptomyces sp. B15]|uniref:DUF397 domain-containing protein n=1 Tax=Streptomyces sp. B15 TaxID=1537797 RepID=UPI001FFDD1D5|nr:DUF397 domain-containing protein [Streptomyces sp. B15]